MRWRVWLVMLLGLCSSGASCGQTALSILPGVINDPANRTLRRELFAFAISELCTEMQARSVPLKLRDADPNIGRFFPNGCSVQQMPNENLFVTFAGHGYAWTNVTGRMGFTASAGVEYDQDFLMDGSTMYIYFRQVRTQASNLQVSMVERSGGAVGQVAGLLGTSVQGIAQQVGDRIMSHQLARGFSVVRESDGTVTFTLGVIDKGAQPFAPFGRGDSDWTLLANDRSEIHVGQRDFAGPFQIEDDDDALWLTTVIEGAPALDIQIFAKASIDPWIEQYERNAVAGPPPGPPMFDEVVSPPVAAYGAPAAPYRRAVRLPVGSYYVVFDNTPTSGRTAPAPQPGDDRAALVSYAVQLGDAP
jgi:hypothetical protein